MRAAVKNGEKDNWNVRSSSAINITLHEARKASMQWNTDLPVNRAAWIEKNEAGIRNIGILHWASWNKNILFPEKSGNKVCLLCHFSVGYGHKTDFSCRNRSLFGVITDLNAIFSHRTVVWGLILRLQMEYFTVVTVTGRIAVSTRTV